MNKKVARKLTTMKEDDRNERKQKHDNQTTKMTIQTRYRKSHSESKEMSTEDNLEIPTKRFVKLGSRNYGNCDRFHSCRGNSTM